ncbi:MAG: redoxin family protein, partial [Bacteroidales bacterium]|nr:redoxin family protein [Bacteroidales bacterium]
MNRKTLIKSFIILFSFLISCTNENKPKEEKSKNNQITLIFKSPPASWRVYREAGKYTPARCEVDFVDDNFIPIHYFPDTEKESDTLIVKTRRAFVEFRHSYKGIDKLSYLFQNGDTVLFKYQEKTPIASVLNRVSKNQDVNFDLFKRETFYPNDYPSFVKCRDPFLFMKESENLQQEFERVEALANENFNVEIIKEQTLLDSLYKNNLISNEVYNLFYRQSIYQQKIIELQNLIGGKRPHKEDIPKLTKENFKIQLRYDIETGFIDGEDLVDSKNDSLFYFGYYKDLMDWIYFNYLSRKVGTVSSINYVDGIATAGGIDPDYLALYDTINNCNLFSKQAINALKLKTIQKIIENNSIDESRLAFEKFKCDVNEPLLVNFVRNKYRLPVDVSTDTDDLKLYSINSETSSFNELIERHKGKVIYIDFWSGGCLPCIKQFEFSERLKELYKDKNLVQIYISIESDKKLWKKACEKYNLLT